MGGQVTTVPDNFAYGVDGEYTVTLLDPAAKKFCRTFPTFTTRDHQRDLSHAKKYKVKGELAYKVRNTQMGKDNGFDARYYFPNQGKCTFVCTTNELDPSERTRRATVSSGRPSLASRRRRLNAIIERFQRESIRCINS